MIFINKSMISYMKYDDYNDNHCDNHCDDIELELYNTYIIKYAGQYTAMIIQWYVKYYN